MCSVQGNSLSRNTLNMQKSYVLIRQASSGFLKFYLFAKTTTAHPGNKHLCIDINVTYTSDCTCELSETVLDNVNLFNFIWLRCQACIKLLISLFDVIF